MFCKRVDTLTETEYSLEITLVYDDEEDTDSEVERHYVVTQIADAYRKHKDQFPVIQNFFDHVEIKGASIGEINEICQAVISEIASPSVSDVDEVE